jgi:hypothetical protein
MTLKAKALIPSDVTEQAPGIGRDLAMATDELNASIQDVEDAFAEWKLGVTAAVDLELPDSRGHRRQLRYRKRNNAWILVVETDSDSRHPEPLTTQSRTVRLQSIARIPALSRALLNEAQTQIAAVRQAVADVQRFIESLHHP